MIILEDLTINSSNNIKETLTKINNNSRGIIFVTNNNQILVGVATDGDIRRALIKGLNIEDKISEAMNKNFIALNVEAEDKLIRKSFNSRIKIIPLCDTKGKLVDFADVQSNHRIPVLEPSLNGNELFYVEDCLKTNWISSQGSYVNKFEEIFKKLHCEMSSIAVSNGTCALHLALLALSIGEGDEVIVPDITFSATINSVIHCGAKPVICDINPKTLCMDLDSIKRLISCNTKAIVPVHLYGQVCDMENIKKIAIDNDLFIIEDCAEALGSSIKNKPVGTFGDAATFSFFGNKTISTGEGGMVLFKNRKFAEKARIIRDHGMDPKKRYWQLYVGHNYRMTNLQAAIGVAQMEKFDDIVKKKIFIANRYNSLLSGIEGIETFPFTKSNTINSYWLYTIILKKNISRDSLIKKLIEFGIDSRPVFYPLHEMPPYKKFTNKMNHFEFSDIAYSGISLPSSINLKKDEIMYICQVLSNLLIDEKRF